ncbi:hypothetical protein SARC_08463 [Sphaeroforma arctica JP610]|uniref:GOST seven transmembrane domain-containing protein n=1 Tax=Sphaeroforma arctica JP610 TaxID=667725 RepID=A0A0L0FRG0_9EUKA|nr:hypothetical protein SARC_08463 [Sphaeroforma arctica JP610]KNC79136.1 hypothetical protein SARC_08463 [Sphaeroforma arctica JP610]|eukprot:XP_014153038.1 hypothetical protein SARC_08463 [Sphaeroforma arctica JP610]
MKGVFCTLIWCVLCINLPLLVKADNHTEFNSLTVTACTPVVQFGLKSGGELELNVNEWMLNSTSVSGIYIRRTLNSLTSQIQDRSDGGRFCVLDQWHVKNMKNGNKKKTKYHPKGGMGGMFTIQNSVIAQITNGCLEAPVVLFPGLEEYIAVEVTGNTSVTSASGTNTCASRVALRITDDRAAGLYTAYACNCEGSGGGAGLVIPDGNTTAAQVLKEEETKTSLQERGYQRNHHKYHPPLTYNISVVAFNLQMDYAEGSDDRVTKRNYLSAGLIPLPQVYAGCSLCFGTLAVWLGYLMYSGREHVNFVHVLLVLLVITKAVSLVLHSVWYTRIQYVGTASEPWNILFYVLHFMKAMLMFAVLLLIGSGAFFVKHTISEKDQRVLYIVLGLQVLSNVAYMVLEEANIGDRASVADSMLSSLVYMVDFGCFVGVWYVMVGVIKHLQMATEDRDKHAVSVHKLNLFKRFYSVVIFYVYLSRLGIPMFADAIPYDYQWIPDALLQALAFGVFTMVAIWFRPAPDNPYFSIPQEDDIDVEEMELGTLVISEGADDARDDFEVSPLVVASDTRDNESSMRRVRRG